MAAGYGQHYWDNGDRVVVELDDSDDDSDTQGVGLISTTGKRFSSDPLRFTGIDMGEALVRSRKNYAYEQTEDDDSSGSDQDTELDESQAHAFSRDEEEALVQSATRRIRKAQASGKEDVKLSKKELAALENRRRRVQAEASGGKKKKKREQRYAVPLSQFAPISQKESRRARGDTLPQHPSPEAVERAQGPRHQPPVGWFAHPASSRPGTTDSRQTPSRTSDRDHSTSPFQYSYVQQPDPASNLRHRSDPTMHPRSTRGHPSHEGTYMSQYNPSASAQSVPATLDPFRYMTSGPQAPYHGSPASASNRTFSGSSIDHSRSASASRRQSRHFTPDDEDSFSEDNDDDSNDEPDSGARVGSANARLSMDGREQIVVEVEPEPVMEGRVTRSKKASGGPSPKRKPIGSGSGRRKKANR